MNSDHQSYDAPEPGFITRLFIHLAGADPKVFSQLPPHEMSDYAKMGVTVLVPFLLALSAGSFTIYTIQDPKNLAYAVIFGAVWAFVILAIDVAIMSQINKRVIIQTAQNIPSPAHLGGRQRPASAQHQVAGSALRNFIVATMRILIAVTLGTLMSHCLVLAVFRGRVIERVLESRAAPRAEVVKIFGEAVKKAEADLHGAQAVSAETDDSVFKLKYERFKETSAPAPSASAPAAKGDATATAQPASSGQDVYSSNPNLQALKKSMDELEQRYAVDSTSLETELESQKSDLAKYRRDIKAAERLKELERGSKNGDAVVFESTEFKVLGAPSGKPGEGTRWLRIQTFIADWQKKTEAMALEIKDKEQKLVTINNAYAEAKAKQQKEIDSLADLLGANVRQGLTTASENLKTFAQNGRAALQTEINERKQRVEEARTLFNEKLRPFDTQSYDLLAMTVALHDLALGRDEKSKQDGSSTTVILAILVLVMLCLMFIDLTPLLIKLMKPATAYDQYVAQMKMMPLAAWSRPAGAQPPPSPESYPAPAPQSQARRTPPPPPPRPRS